MLQNISIRLSLVWGIAIVFLSSCQEEDFGVTTQEYKEIQYAKTFGNIFVDVDSEHDWSMAGKYLATVNLKDDVNGTLMIYSGSPRDPETQLLAVALVENGSVEVDFDALKDTKMLHARIKDYQGQVVESGFYNVKDNAIVNKKEVTRGQVDASSITKVEKIM